MLRVELINQDKSNVFIPGQQGAGRGWWKGEKKVTVSRMRMAESCWWLLQGQRAYVGRVAQM